MNLAATTLWSGVSTALRMIAGIVSVKVVAMVAGPSGIALLGQFQNFVQVVTSLSGSLLQTGVLKHAAEYKDNSEKLARYLGTVGRVALIFSIVATILLLIFHGWLAKWLMKSQSYDFLFLLSGAMIALLVANSIALGLLNGLGEIKTYLVIATLGSLFSMLMMVGMTLMFGIDGALYSAVITPAIAVLFTAIGLRRSWKLFSQGWACGWHWDEMRKLAKFALMGLAGALSLPLALLGIRSALVSQLGWDAAGYWQAVWQISGAYLALFTTGISVYYLPRLSAERDVSQLKKEMRGYFRIIFPAALIIALLIFLFREIILGLLYSGKFSAASELFAWQILADVIRVATWGYGYLQHAKGMARTFIAKELAFGAAYYFGVVISLPFLGLLAVTKVYVLLCLINGLFVIWVVHRRLSVLVW